MVASFGNCFLWMSALVCRIARDSLVKSGDCFKRNLSQVFRRVHLTEYDVRRSR
ncbi:hypothetical protein KC19_6G008300 [Ceratodon purpureus]|uniref:Uncharacterized protein n=1 Tax=Ceratodon purpureus TaxID=3225 RepID=A0A8T0HA20_CERPU|nr:hypothetical protein KC19_6G008300 [Ceratodon purpureus]